MFFSLSLPTQRYPSFCSVFHNEKWLKPVCGFSFHYFKENCVSKLANIFIQLYKDRSIGIAQIWKFWSASRIFGGTLHTRSSRCVTDRKIWKPPIFFFLSIKKLVVKIGESLYYWTPDDWTEAWFSLNST